jgi:glycosyltransferase involved in cell wall biosynthesis
MPNILNAETVRAAAREPSDAPPKTAGTLRFVTACRLDIRHKGLDRGVKAFARLKAERRLDGAEWHIIGDGPDAEVLRESIRAEGLEGTVVLAGERKNPMPYVASGDVFFLPSRFEGRPMAVTEAQILGVPPAVTAYASAHEQIRDRVDGRVWDNDDESVYRGLAELMDDRESLAAMTRETRARDYGNERDMARFYEAVRGLGL